MTMRRFLLCYAGAMVFVAAFAAGAWQALQHRPAAAPAPAVVAAEPELPAAAETFSAEPQAAPPPKPRLHIVKATRPNVPERRRTVIAHSPARRPATIASVRRLGPPGGTWPYAAPPPPPPYPGPYAYPAQYPDFYPYYPRYGYYRSF